MTAAKLFGCVIGFLGIIDLQFKRIKRRYSSFLSWRWIYFFVYGRQWLFFRSDEKICCL